jgi:hypothetical protein
MPSVAHLQAALLEHLVRHIQRRIRDRRAGVKQQVQHDLEDLVRRQPHIEAAGDMAPQVLVPPQHGQRGDRDDAALARRQHVARPEHAEAGLLDDAPLVRRNVTEQRADYWLAIRIDTPKLGQHRHRGLEPFFKTRHFNSPLLASSYWQTRSKFAFEALCYARS